jgi:hypothetical protein
MPDPEPKLRVLDDAPADPAEVVRLGGRGMSAQRVERLPGPPPPEPAERLESEARENFGGRSAEPGVEAILDTAEMAGSVEQPWGLEVSRLRGVPYGWFVLIFVTLAGAGVWSIQAMRQGEERLEIDHGTVREMVERDQVETKAATLLVERVEQAVAAYLEADTIDGMLAWVRHPERVRPMIEAEWQLRPKPSLKFARMTLFQPATLGQKPFWVVQAEVRDGEPQSLLVEQTAENAVKIDWETHVCRQPMEWGRYVADRPTGKALDFRLLAMPDTLYSHEFSDGGRWNCFRLLARNSDESLFGYAPAGGEVAQQLEALCRAAPGQQATVLLRLRVPEGIASSRGVVIERIVAPRWLILEEPPQDSP